VAVHDYSPGSTPKPAYMGSKKSPHNLEFSIEMHKLKVALKQRDSTTEIGMIPASEKGNFINVMDLSV